jgi:hypothetical protein
MHYVVPLDEEVPPPATFAFSWLSGLLLYGTRHDDGNAAWDTWVLTHPELRLSTALNAGIGVDEAPGRKLVEDGATIEDEMWDGFVPGLMAHLRGLLPEGLDNSRPLTAMRHAFPERVARQTVVFVPGVRGEIPRIGTHFFGLTVERQPRAWRVVGVQREWTMPEWFLDADAELPGTTEP